MIYCGLYVLITCHHLLQNVLDKKSESFDGQCSRETVRNTILDSLSPSGILNFMTALKHRNLTTSDAWWISRFEKPGVGRYPCP